MTTTFRQWLTEGELTFEDAISLYHKKFSDWPLDHPLYRAVADHYTDPVELSSRKREKSLGGSTAFQKWLFSQPDWDQLPDRSKSVFGATEKSGPIFRKDSRSAYVMLPANGANLAVWISEDFNTWRIPGIESSIPRIVSTIFDMLTEVEYSTGEDVNEYVQEKFGIGYNPQRGTVSYPTFESLIKAMRYIKDLVEQEGVMDELSGPAQDVLEFFDSPSKYFKLSELVTTTTPSTYQSDGKAHEVWFEGDYLLIPIDQWDKFKEAVTKG